MNFAEKKQSLTNRYNQLNQAVNQMTIEMQRILGQLAFIEEIQKEEELKEEKKRENEKIKKEKK